MTRINICLAICGGWMIGAASAQAQGVPNRIPVWIDSTNLGNSVLFQSGTNIGLGTTAPTNPLDIVMDNPAAGSGLTATIPRMILNSHRAGCLPCCRAGNPGTRVVRIRWSA